MDSWASFRRLCALGFALLGGACAFDWAVRSAPDGGRDGAAPDADAGAEAAAPGDAEVADAGEAGTACDTLVAAVVAARAKARTCQIAAGQCGTKAKDECDCDVFIAEAGTPAAADFADKAAQAKAAWCLGQCPASCPVLPVSGGCVQKPSTLFECSP